MIIVLRRLYERIKRADIFITIIFFGLLLCGLLLGDGKQGVIEVFSGSIVLVCWGVFRLKGCVLRRLPTSLSVAWIGFSIVVYVSLLRSDSVGLSLSWFIRFFSSYTLYLLFYSLASKTTTKVFIVGSLVLAAGAAGLSILSSSFLFVRDMLPSMNLVDTRYGHSHLADLLVFVCPAVLYWLYYSGVSTRKKLLVVISCLTALFFTFARGAWIVVGTYGLVWVGKILMDGKKKSALVVALVIFVLVGAIIGISRLSFLPQKVDTQLMRPVTVSSRLEYWRQAIETFRERPLFGSGPGTFSLESQRFQKTASQSSWFAHSILLQTLAETGAAGLLAFLWLIATHIVYVLRRPIVFKDRPLVVIAHGCSLVFLYGLFEFVLDYQVMWLLFWGGVGLLSGMSSVDKGNKEGGGPLFTLSLWYVAAFYFLWMCSAIASVLGFRASTVYLLAPYDAGNALMALTKTKDPKHVSFVSTAAHFFHAKNPNILVEISKAQKLLHKDADARYSMETVAYSYPVLEAVQKEYVLSLVESKDYESIARWLRNISPKLFYSDARYTNEDLVISRESIEFTSQHLPALFNEKISPHIRYSRYFYALGLYYLSRDTQKTNSLWRLANNLQPDLSYLWIERAAFERYISIDTGAANDILRECQKNVSARSHCSWTLYNQEMPQPGGFQKQIYGE